MDMITKFSFTFYVFTNNFNCLKQSYFSWNFLYLSKKNVLDQTWKASNTKFWHKWKDRESIYQVRKILALSCELVALT